MQVAAENSFHIPYPLRRADCDEHVFVVSSALAAFGQSAREAIGLATNYADADTADLFTEVSRGIDRQLCSSSHIGLQTERANARFGRAWTM